MVRHVVFWVLLCLSNTLFSQIDTIEAVDIREEKSANKYDSKGMQLRNTLSENEFKKAACCTLSESFELSNTVEVSNKDGISGIRQVEMLGLSGKYVLMTRNNMPILNGISQLNGLSNIPGPFVSNVHISKGNGSATLGFEGLTGGIDYELKASEKEPRLFLNLYQNNQGRTEGNVLFRHDFNSNLRNFTYLHHGKQWTTTDMNEDGFADMPMTNRTYLGNQTHFQTKHTEGMFGVTYWTDDKNSGTTTGIGTKELSNDPNSFRFTSNEHRLDIFAKLGIIPEEGETTFGNILNFSKHRMNYLLNSLDNRRYSADEYRFQYSGLIQSEITETWGIKSGVSVLGTQLHEQFNLLGFDASFNELQIGVFGESVYAADRIKWVIGSRLDYHNYHGWLFTPRTHLKFELNKSNTLFLQGGYGRRQSYLLSENIPLMINNRSIEGFIGHQTHLPYGFQQERGWNYGVSYLRRFLFADFPSSIAVDIFRNQFDYRIIADQERFGNVLFHGLNGKEAGFSESIHLEWTFIPLMRMEVKLAYRYVNNQMLLGDNIQLVPLLSVHRGLSTLTYKTRSNWYFDIMGSINGPKQLMSQVVHATTRTQTPLFALFNVQIRKIWNGWDGYLGVENIGNFRQLNPILTRNNGQYVDASYSWGPSNGRMIYAGFRFELK